jgi:hypothetical protein
LPGADRAVVGENVVVIAEALSADEKARRQNDGTGHG